MLRLIISSSSTVIYQLNFESFPTPVRGMGPKFVILLGFMGGLILPKILAIFQEH